MTEEQKMGFRQEGEPAFKSESENENENSSESSTEETNANQTQSQEGEQNSGEENKDDGKEEKDFSKHPRWKEREEDWKERFNEQEKRHLESINQLREEFSTKDVKQKSTDVDIPDWFGGDEEQWAKYKAHEESLVSKAKEEALQEINNKTSSEQKAIDEATKYFNDQVAELESSSELNPDGLTVDKNKLLKFVMEEDLVDSQGRWNYKAGFRMMKAGLVKAKNDSINEKKAVAKATTSESKAESKKESFTTSKDFQNPSQRPW